MINLPVYIPPSLAMVQPHPFVWKQLSGPQLQAIATAIYEWIKKQFDYPLGQLQYAAVDTVGSAVLTTVGMIQDIRRPTVKAQDSLSFFFTHNSIRGTTPLTTPDSVGGTYSTTDGYSQGFSTLADVQTTGGGTIRQGKKGLGGLITSTEPVDALQYAAYMSDALFRPMLKLLAANEGVIGSLRLLDVFCFTILSVFSVDPQHPTYAYEFMKAPNADYSLGPGDCLVHLTGEANYSEAGTPIAMLKQLFQSLFLPDVHIDLVADDWGEKPQKQYVELFPNIAADTITGTDANVILWYGEVPTKAYSYTTNDGMHWFYTSEWPWYMEISATNVNVTFRGIHELDSPIKPYQKFSATKERELIVPVVEWSHQSGTLQPGAVYGGNYGLTGEMPNYYAWGTIYQLGSQTFQPARFGSASSSLSAGGNLPTDSTGYCGRAGFLTWDGTDINWEKSIKPADTLKITGVTKAYINANSIGRFIIAAFEMPEDWIGCIAVDETETSFSDSIIHTSVGDISATANSGTKTVIRGASIAYYDKTVTDKKTHVTSVVKTPYIAINIASRYFTATGSGQRMNPALRTAAIYPAFSGSDGATLQGVTLLHPIETHIFAADNQGRHYHGAITLEKGRYNAI